MQGLRHLYGHTGRRAEWRRLVEQIVPDLVNPETEGPLPGREEVWSVVTGCRVQLAQDERKWAEAERLTHVRVNWDRRRAAQVLELPRVSLDRWQRNIVRTLAIGLAELGHTQRELGRELCVAAFEEALKLSESIGDQAHAMALAQQLGNAYCTVPALRDLCRARHWYQRSLELVDECDPLGRSTCLTQLGFVAFERFREAREQKRPEDELARHLNDAGRLCSQALEHIPPDAVGPLAGIHHGLGQVYLNAGDIDRAMAHFRDAIRYEEKQDNVSGASVTRYDIAIGLSDAGRPQDGLEYARAALRGFESYGDSAAERIQQTRQLIEIIEQQL